MGFSGGSVVKNLPANAQDKDLISGLGGSPGGGNGNPLQYFCLENRMDRGPWWAIVHRVTESQTQLSTHTHNYIMLMCAWSLSHVQLFPTLWTVAQQAPLFMGFSRQEYWSGLPFPPRDLPNPGTEPGSPALQADSLPSEPP